MELEDTLRHLRLRGAGGQDRDGRRRGRLRARARPRRERRPRASPSSSRELPDDLRSQALTHSSWTEERADSYERLAYLGDSVLALAVAARPLRALPRASTPAG